MPPSDARRAARATVLGGASASANRLPIERTRGRPVHHDRTAFRAPLSAFPLTL